MATKESVIQESDHMLRTGCDQKCRTFQSKECEYHQAVWRWAQLHFLPSKTLRGGCH